MDAGLWKDSREASQVTLAEALGRYLQTVTLRKMPKTQLSEQLSSKYLIQHMGKLSLLQVTPEKVATYRDKRLNSVSPNSVRIELSLLSHLFNIAIREWSFFGLENPVRLIQKPKTPEGRCPILSENQMIRLLGECKNTNCRLLYPFVLLSLHTGGRSSELRKLREL
jgi:integrase